jgi:hypothetical protein
MLITIYQMWTINQKIDASNWTICSYDLRIARSSSLEMMLKTRQSLVDFRQYFTDFSNLVSVTMAIPEKLLVLNFDEDIEPLAKENEDLL